MNRTPRTICAIVLAGTAVLSAIGLTVQAQEPPTAGESPAVTDDAMPTLTLAEVEAALATIEANDGIDDAVKHLLRPKYEQAIEALKEAAGFAAKTAEYREAIRTAPEKAADIRDEMQALPPAEDAAKPVAPGKTEYLQREIDSQRAALNSLKDELSRVTSQLASVKNRPVEISARLPEAQRELSGIRKGLASPALNEVILSPGSVADRLLLRATESRLQRELEMLGQEQLSLSVRENLLQAHQELLTHQTENVAAALGALETLAHSRLASEANRLSSLSDTLARDVSEEDATVQTLATEVQVLAKEFEDVVDNLENARVAQEDITAKRESLTREYESIQAQLQLGSGEGEMARVLFDLDRKALNARVDVLTAAVPTLTEARLAAIDVEKEFRRQTDKESEFSDHPSDKVARLVATRREVLEKLRPQRGNLTRALAVLQGDESKYLQKAEEVRSYVWEQFFGFKVRSCPAIGVRTIAEVPGGLRWLLGGDHWRELGSALAWATRRMPVRSIGIVILAAVLLVWRRRIVVTLERTEVPIRRISTDRYAYTGKALIWTSLLVVPVPILIGFVGWALGQLPTPSDWMRGIARGLQIAAWIMLVMGFMAAVCRPGGLGAAHFRWSDEAIARFRKTIQRFTVVYIPALLLTFSCAYGDASQYHDSVGRISFILAHIWAAIVLWQLFQSSDSVPAVLTRERPTRVMVRWRSLWFSLLLACPIALVVFACIGYLVTAVTLSLGLVTTVAIIAAGEVLYCLALRWFMLRQRKLALAERLERWRERQEAAASQDQQEVSGEVVSVDPDDEEEMDLDAISEQTRALLRLLFGLGVASAIIFFWSQSFPVVAVVDSISIPLTGGLSLLGLTQAVLVLVVTYIATKNLPGLLELAVLRATSIEAGTRTAIETLCQYAVIAIGLVVLVNVLQVDWVKFGWIATALSVGLGFGLQEVVANFVSGLVVLLERPIRVGDVVTVEGMTGTVTKIQMRATTIMNWDRQEFVVPNKTLITSTLLNWTLSTPLTRVVIPVGVAYGSDTDKAREILIDVAADHPRVLDDPAPMATFEQFADSSLNLMLRAHLPDPKNRIGTITELHTEINKRFAAAGIEIAFPQHDLHLRSGWNDLRRANSDGSEDGKKDPATG
jgi:potassium efflux system protein